MFKVHKRVISELVLVLSVLFCLSSKAQGPLIEFDPLPDLNAPEEVEPAEKPKQVVQLKEETGFRFTADFYGSHADLMQYKGYQDDLSATLYLQYLPYRLVPFLRFLNTNYYYRVSPQTEFISDRRLAVGGGLDYRFTSWLRFRAITEAINDKSATRNISQVSYGIIYNQYISTSIVEFNNYLESFLIPRLSSNKIDTFARMQIFKTFYVERGAASSHVVFPFMEGKTKINDDLIFGLTGQNASVGLGYKYFMQNSAYDSFALLAEAHSVIYQTKEFSSDWYQFLVAMQWVTN